MRDVDITGAVLLGPQDFLWWVTMMQNDHIMAASGASIVRLPQKSGYTVGAVVDVAHDTLDISARYGIYGAVVANIQGYSLIKILGPARVRWATPPTEVGMLAVMNGAGACVAARREDITDLKRVLGVALEVPTSGLGMVAIGNPGKGSQNEVPVTMSGQRLKIACCVVNLAGPSIDTSYANIGIASVTRSGNCGYAYGTTDGTITVNFAGGWFSDTPKVKASLEGVSQGIFVYDHTGGAGRTHLMFRRRETIVSTNMTGKMHVFAIGHGV